MELAFFNIRFTRTILDVLSPICTIVLDSSKGKSNGDDSSIALITPYDVFPTFPVYFTATDGSLMVLE